jgi:hypothetical protein
MMEAFPTRSQLDAKYDFWPELGKPFICKETGSTVGQQQKGTGYGNQVNN